MAKMGVFQTAPRKWFPYDEDSLVLIEYINKERIGKLIEKSQKSAQALKASQSIVYDVFFGKEAVHGWKHGIKENHAGLLLPNGTPIEFTPENRNMLMRGCREFSDFVFLTATSAKNFLEDNEEDPDAKGLDGLDEFMENMDEGPEIKN